MSLQSVHHYHGSDGDQIEIVEEYGYKSFGFERKKGSDFVEFIYVPDTNNDEEIRIYLDDEALKSLYLYFKEVVPNEQSALGAEEY